MAAIGSMQIIPYYAHPHVHTVINDDSYYDETVATAEQDLGDLPFSTVIVTGADQGIDNKFVRLSDRETKVRVFGKSNFKKYGQPSIQADVLFNGSTNVWFMRVLPDNATYANLVILAHYRKGKILDKLGQETGKVRMEVKYSIAYATKPKLSNGAREDYDIEDFANSLRHDSPDPITGYMTVPLCYIRATGRGRYGNSYSVYISRDTDAEREYSLKMFMFNLVSNDDTTKPKNIISGSLFQTTRYDASTLIQDVIDQYDVGASPIHIVSLEDSFNTLFDFYKSIVKTNETYLLASDMSKEDQADLQYAQKITEDSFDPFFGYKLNSRTDEVIPYYQNYTEKPNGYQAPALTIPNQVGASKPLNTSDWNSAYVGAKVLVLADPLNGGKRWMYTVTVIEPLTGNIIYDEGVPSAIDEDQYDGTNLKNPVGMILDGGHDGDFEEISVNGKTRIPTEAEMKILLAREQVKAFRGEKDNKILSATRMNLDFIFDANYNMTNVSGLEVDTVNAPLYNGSTVLTDKDAQQLSVLGSGTMAIDFSDLNVKKAMYDVNTFRNKNGITVDKANMGAGGHLYLDTNLVGLKNLTVNYELKSLIDAMEQFDGRATSIDLGFYDIYDPVSKKKVHVTVGYMLAAGLIPHIVRYGINKPFVYNHAQLTALQRTSSRMTVGNMIRDSFRPNVDVIDWDVKELLFKSRINYYITTDEGRRVQRAVQNTRQRDASALLEESNVRVLNTLKKGLEKANRGYLFEYNDASVRKGFTTAQMKIYRPWIGTLVEDLKIYFEANEWEAERMMMHCYCSVKFKDIIKRIILEINISRPDRSGEEEADS